MRPAVSSGPSTSAAKASEFARTLHQTLTRIGYFDQSNAASHGGISKSRAASSAVMDPSQLEWLESALEQSERVDGASVWALLHSLQLGQVLSTQEVQAYQTLRDKKQFISNPAELHHALQAHGVDIEDDDEDEDLEALEREVAALQSECISTDSYIASLHQCRDQLSDSIRQTATRKQELETLFDAQENQMKEIEEALLQQQHAHAHATHRQKSSGVAPTSISMPRSNKIGRLQTLHNESMELNKDNDELLNSLSHTAAQIEQVLVQGKMPQYRTDAEAVAAAAAAHAEQQKKKATTASGATLPSMSTESMSALNAEFDPDSFHARQKSPNGTSSSKTSSQSAASGSSNNTSLDNISPYLLHHPTALQEYLTHDDEWARKLNQFFRTRFGAGATASAAAESSYAKTLEQTAHAERVESQIRSVLLATPHGKHLMRGGVAAGNTQTPARGRIGQHHAAPSARKDHSNHQSSFKTPPHGSSAPDAGDEATSNGDDHASSSSLSPALHAAYSAELTRLYNSFPSSQDYWLYHNLLFLSVKARITEQHAIMVREGVYRSMNRQQVNEAIAEAGMQHAALNKQLAMLLTGKDVVEDDSSESTSKKKPSSAGVDAMGGFQKLWQDLRSLQLLEILRVDLDFKFLRQESYLTAQLNLVKQFLLQQRARHELVLGAWRMEWGRINELKALLESLWNSMDATNRSAATRTKALEQLHATHEASRTMMDPARLTIDMRSTFLFRLSKLTHSIRQTLERDSEKLREGFVRTFVPPSTTPRSGRADRALNPFFGLDAVGGVESVSHSSVNSFDALLDASKALSLAPSGAADVLQRDQSRRSDNLAQLSAQAQRARKMLFEDEEDVSINVVASDDAAAVAGTSGGGGGAAMPFRTSLERWESNVFSTLKNRVHGKVEEAGEGLNKFVQELSVKKSQLTSRDNTGEEGSALIERETRGVWTEFIQAPEALEERMRLLQKKLQALQTTASATR